MRVLILFIIYYLFLLFYGVNLSFSIFEAQSMEKFWPLKYILEFSFYLFGKNDFALRLPEIFFSVLSVLLFFTLAKRYLTKSKDIELATVIFALIPGFIVSSLIVNKSIYLIFLILLYFVFFDSFFSYLLLGMYVFLDSSFLVLYLGLFFYSIFNKKKVLLILSLVLFALNANYFNYKISGKPHGYFLDVFGIYILIFSPFVFIYFVYTLYRGFFYKKNVVFYVSLTAFIASIFFSFRQRIKIDDYSPYVLPYVLNMVKIFLNSYRIRLPKFRTFYKFLFGFLFFSMTFFDVMLFFNKYTPARDMSNSFYFIKPLVKILKKHRINNIHCQNRYLCKSLSFYGLKLGNRYLIVYSKRKDLVSIFHKKRKILRINVSKLNTL